MIGFYPALSVMAAAPEEWLRTYSPAHALAANGGPSSPPTLIVRAGKDSEMLNNGIAEFASKALSRNTPLTLLNLPEAQHGFDLFDDEDWSREAIEEAFAFARRCIGPSARIGNRTKELKEELIRLEEERQEAYVRGDRSVLDKHFAEEYVHTNLRGGTTTRSQELDFYAPGSFTLESGTLEDVEVHKYGETAVLLAAVNWKGAQDRAPGGRTIDLSGRFRVTRTYVWRDQRWQVVASHASKIGP